jgi:hypothetical protein
MSLLTPAPFNFQQRIRSELIEGLQLSYNDIIPTIIHLRVTMIGDGLVVPPQATDTFRIPGDYNFLVAEMHAHVVLNSPTTEEIGTGGILALYGIKNRVAAKALNAKALLVNADRNDLTFVEANISNSSSNGNVQSPLVLGTLMPICGGAPIKMIDQGYIAPLIVPANERLQLTVNLTDAVAAKGSAEYGLAMIGALVRMRVG